MKVDFAQRNANQHKRQRENMTLNGIITSFSVFWVNCGGGIGGGDVSVFFSCA